MKKSIVLVTTTRADWGLMRPLALRLLHNPEIELSIACTGSHLSNEFGLTYREIEEDGFTIDKKIEILLSSDSKQAMNQAMALAIQGFSAYFQEKHFDALLILGDRFEILGICAAALTMHIPIMHLCGGETTEGALDESIRHAVTKMSTLHFTSCEPYRKRVIQMGEDPKRVFNVGSLSIDNIVHLPLLSRVELAESLQNPLLASQPYAIVTFHPVTLENDTALQQIKQLLDALTTFPEYQFIFTKANADAGGRLINEYVTSYCQTHKQMTLYDSLGNVRYLSAISHAEMIIGNSSSGLTEVPYFKIPTINIGDRQKGRLRASSIIDCEPIAKHIRSAILQAQSTEFLSICQSQINPYGDGHTAEKIIEIMTTFFSSYCYHDRKKTFYDIAFHE